MPRYAVKKSRAKDKSKTIVTPVCIVVDISKSMKNTHTNGERNIDRLNRGLNLLIRKFIENEKENHSTEIAIVTFGYEAKERNPFTDVNAYGEIQIEASDSQGDIPKGVEKALKLLQRKCESLKENGIRKRKPWLVIMSDGRASGENIDKRMREMQKRTSEEEELRVVPVYIYDPNPRTLQLTRDKACRDLAAFRTGKDTNDEIAKNNCIRIENGEDDFDKFFANLSSSISDGNLGGIFNDSEEDIFQKFWEKQDENSIEENEDYIQAPTFNSKEDNEIIYEAQTEEVQEMQIEAEEPQAIKEEPVVFFGTEQNYVLDIDDDTEGDEEETLKDGDLPTSLDIKENINVDSIIKPYFDDPKNWDDI